MLAEQRAPIVAIATAPGRGAIGIVRVSGGSSTEMVKMLSVALQVGVSRQEGQVGVSNPLSRPPISRHAHLAFFLDGVGRPIDQGLMLRFEAPNSYTGEDLLELQCHGGPVVLQLVLERCLELGAASQIRLAKPGEFTQRAYINGKLDLSQAEGVADLIDASTRAAAQGAASLMRGALSGVVSQLMSSVIEARVWVEANIDFPEEDIDRESLDAFDVRLSELKERLNECQRTAKQGRLLRDGIRVVIAGQPNAGKSAMLNALSGAEVAIVTPIPGTTRDTIEQSVQIEGIPIHLIDTAGLRETQDIVERIGVSRAWEAIGRAQAIVFVHDSLQATDPQKVAADESIRAAFPVDIPVIDVWTKQDLLPQPLCESGIAWSICTGQGLYELRRALLALAGWQPSGETPFTAQQRHTLALNGAEERLAACLALLSHSQPALELLAEELRLAHGALEGIGGRYLPDDLLGEIFSKFCIGK